MEQKLGALVWVRLLGFESFTLAFCNPPFPICQKRDYDSTDPTERSDEICRKHLIHS